MAPTLESLAAAECMRVDRVTAEVAQALQKRGISSVLMKGPVFADKLYHDQLVRPYGDSDILVSPSDFEKAEQTLEDLGFRNALGPLAHPRMDAQQWIRGSADVDLHRTLWGIDASPEEVWAELSSRIERRWVSGVEVQALDDVASALQVAIHAAHHGAASAKSLHDLERALDMFSDEIWIEATVLARRLQATGAFATGLRMVPAGDVLARSLGLAQAHSREASLRVSRVPVSQGIEHLLATQGVRRKAALLAREAFPTPAFMRWWSPTARKGLIGLAAAYAWRLLWLVQHLPSGLRAWRAAEHHDGGGLSNTTESYAERLAKERDFHDLLAAELRARPLLPSRPPDELEVSLLTLAGPLSDKVVLDLGCGSGDMTIELLRRGAQVNALDISPGMIDLVRRRAAQLNPNGNLSLHVAPAEALSIPDGSVDLVVGKWILHHVDIGAATREIARVLRPGGRGIFIENSGTNPLLSFARRHIAGQYGIPRFGTEDEHPLLGSDYVALESRFDEFALHFPDFCFLQLLDRQVFRFRSRRLTRTVRWMDDFVWRRLPTLRRYSFHVIVEVKKH